MSSKPELIAIYRLEFYKKQKNWKLSTARKEKKESKKCTEKESTLNITYDVDNPVKEQSDPLNVAFIDNDLDKNKKLVNQSTNQARLSLERLEAVNIWPQPYNQEYEKTQDLKEKPKVNWTQHRLLQLQMAASMEDDNNDEGTEFRSWSEQASEWKNCEDLIETDCVTNDVWNQEPDMVDGPNSDSVLPGLYAMDSAPSAMSLDEDWCDCSVDSIGEFYRGADAAPHSSEFELTLPPCVSASDVSSSCLSRLSSRQLARAAALHARLLRRLRRESAQREKLRSSLSYSSLSFEDVPTRDVDNLQNDIFVDRIIAGSHRQGEAERQRGMGRGRGRLLERDRYRFL